MDRAGKNSGSSSTGKVFEKVFERLFEGFGKDHHEPRPVLDGVGLSDVITPLPRRRAPKTKYSQPPLERTREEG